uniref:Uncharacterized protein n=1 Tax=Anguilla anguilla TaxID=7936 RepID=A0A0E9QKR4_ANGAN
MQMTLQCWFRIRGLYRPWKTVWKSLSGLHQLKSIGTKVMLC